MAGAPAFRFPARQLTHESSLEAMHAISDRRDRLDQAIASMAYASEYTPIVRSLQCLHGISTLTAFGLAVEISDWDRFTGSTIDAYLGLGPTEHSSGASRSQGSITKTGNGHARRLLVEAAWHHHRPYNIPSRLMRSRWEEASSQARARGHAGNRRLHERWMSYLERPKRPVIANVTIARELSGWCWSLATGSLEINQPTTGLPSLHGTERPGRQRCGICHRSAWSKPAIQLWAPPTGYA